MSATNSKRTDKEKGDSLTLLYGAAIVAVVVIAVAMLIWNSNFFQNRTTAVSINGTNYTASDVAYHYASARQTQAYYAMYGLSSFDYTTSAKDQVYNEEDGTTWHDYLLEQAVTSLTQEAALADQAEKAGITLSEEAQANVAAALDSLESSRISAGYSSRDAYLRANYGAVMTYDKYVQCLNRSALAAEYYNTQADSYTYGQDELNDYYAQHKDELDMYTISQFIFRANVETTDAEGNAIEMTDEEKAAALETAKAEAQANAQALFTRLKAGESAETLKDEYAEQLYSSYASQRMQGSNLSSQYAEWATDAARQNGDTTLVEYAGTGDNSYYYCAVRLENRYQDNQPSANVRHILISAGSSPSDEEYAEALAKAEETLQTWMDGDGTEDGFAQLAMSNSADSSSAANGGLLNVTGYEGYGASFTDWALDTSRQIGDTGIIKNDYSSVKGYHIMYYVGQGEPYWMQYAQSALTNEALTAWQEEIFSGYTAENGSGLKYVG